MKWTSLNDLREKYLAFFESKGHLRLPSYFYFCGVTGVRVEEICLST